MASINIIDEIKITDGEETLSLAEGKIDVLQLEVYTIFNNILKEIKKTNIHLAMMNDYEVKNEDL